MEKLVETLKGAAIFLFIGPEGRSKGRGHGRGKILVNGGSLFEVWGLVSVHSEDVFGDHFVVFLVDFIADNE